MPSFQAQYTVFRVLFGWRRATGTFHLPAAVRAQLRAHLVWSPRLLTAVLAMQKANARLWELVDTLDPAYAHVLFGPVCFSL